MCKAFHHQSIIILSVCPLLTTKDWFSCFYISLHLKMKSFACKLHWIFSGGKSIFTVVILWWRSTLCQFAGAKSFDKYHVTKPMPRVSVTSQFNHGDVTMLRQKLSCLAIMAKWMIDDYFQWVCGFRTWNSVQQIKKPIEVWVAVNNDFMSFVKWFDIDFHSWLWHLWKSLPNRLTRKENRYSHHHYSYTEMVPSTHVMFHTSPTI